MTPARDVTGRPMPTLTAQPAGYLRGSRSGAYAIPANGPRRAPSAPWAKLGTTRFDRSGAAAGARSSDRAISAWELQGVGSASRMHEIGGRAGWIGCASSTRRALGMDGALPTPGTGSQPRFSRRADPTSWTV